MERWLIVVFMSVMFLGLAALGWRYRRQVPDTPGMCTEAEAKCLDHPYFNN